MTFSPLETASITGLVSLLVALTVHVLTKRNYVSHVQCEERRINVCSTLKAVQDEHRELRQDLEGRHKELRQDIRDRTNTLFRMMRAMVVHDTDMPPDVKTEILNETPGRD